MSDCPFCDPDPSRIVWEADGIYAVRDRYPVTPGHTLVIPRRHIPTYFEATQAEQRALWDAVLRIRDELDRTLEPAPEGYNVGFNAGQAAGQTVMHLHIHVIPRRAGDMDDPRGGIRGVIPSKQKYGDEPSFESAARVVTGHAADPLLGRILPALDGASAVDLAVAFVFDAGIELLHDRLVDVLSRPGARVRIVTGDYQDVTEPTALRHLLRLPLIAEADRCGASLQLKAYRVRQAGDSFHPKAWVVRGGGAQAAWVGSSNVSRVALQTGLEWNYEIAAPDEVAGVCRAFERLWSHPATEVVDDDWIDRYERRRRAPTRGGAVVPVAVAEDLPLPRPRPRPGIQQEALLKLEQTRLQDNKAGLVVLATGLGKTYLSAFDSESFERVLFVAHREEILTQALETYRKVRPDSRLGLYYGKDKEPDADVLFASIQTLSSPRHLEAFSPTEFDYIVIDEFHHAAAKTYQRVIDHFEPKFMLGLTATPDRLDEVNLLSYCEGNLVYRCDIPRGVAERQLSPFRYFGIADPAEYEQISWSRYTDDRLADTVAKEVRAEHALATLRKHTDGRVRALGFCVSQRHADFMAREFAERGVACKAVYAGSEAKRTPTLQALANGELEIVFCVDMFNEGVDIPDVDTVFMLRPTESAIIWLQQLGRGLRHVEGKTLTVLDYIGNHAVFSKRPEMLLAALDIEFDRKRDDAYKLLRSADLPPGIEIDLEPQAEKILEELRKQAKKSGAKPVRWYREFRDRHGRRPTALEADDAGWLKQLSRRGGGWLAFVDAEGDLTAPEHAVFRAHPNLFEALEKLPYQKSYKMLILLAVLHLQPFPGRVPKAAIGEWITTRARRSAALMRDLSADGTDPSAIVRLLNKDAFPRLAVTGGGRLFAHTDGSFDTSALRTEHPEALADLMRELVDLRLTKYLEANSSATSIPPILDDAGDPVDARFDVEARDDKTTIVFHSRGGTRGTEHGRNTQYRAGLAILLRRLAEQQLGIERIEVDSDHIHKLGLTREQRTVQIPDRAYPLQLSSREDHEALSRTIGRQSKTIGQSTTVKKGAGNDTRRLRLTLVNPAHPGELWHLLRAPVSIT